MISPFSAHLLDGAPSAPPSDRATLLPTEAPPTIEAVAAEARRLAHLFHALHYLRIATAPAALTDHVRTHIRAWLGVLGSWLREAGHGASAEEVRRHASVVQGRLDTPTEDLRIAGRLEDLARSLGERDIEPGEVSHG